MQLRFRRTKTFFSFFRRGEKGEEIKTLCDSVSRFHVYIRAISCRCFIESDRDVTATFFLFSSLWSMLLVKILYLQAIFSSRKLGPWLKISLGNDFMIYVVTILANSGPSSIKIFTTMIFARKCENMIKFMISLNFYKFVAI